MKRKLPVAVWNVIQPLIDKHRHLLIPVVSKDHDLNLKDSAPGSDFYFYCNKISGRTGYIVEHKPTSTESNSIHREEVNLKDLEMYFKLWLGALNAFDTLHTIYDDPILKSYEEANISYFAMQDEDADQAPFDVVKQLYLDQYLTNIIGLLEIRKANAPEQQAEQIAEIVADCESLKEEMTQLTKNQTVSRLAKIWAKGQKLGLPVIKEFWSEFKKEAYKMVAKTVLTADVTTLDTIMGLIG